MTTEAVHPAAPATPKQSGPKQAREQSSIGFTYGDLDDATSVAAALLSNGGVPCDVDQLAGALKQTPNSGNFRMKVATARMFGVIKTVQGKYQLTPLGFAITDSTRQKAAKADAFLNVPLYRKVYDTFRNQQLPPRTVALERTFVGFGVSSKQADKARMAFDRSAQQAGYFEHGNRDRLIRPAVGTTSSVTPTNGDPPISQYVEPLTAPPTRERLAGGSGGGGGDYHPFIYGLLDVLPAPGTVWSIEGRAAWLEAAASTFKLMYQGDGKITVGVVHDAAKDKSGPQ